MNDWKARSAEKLHDTVDQPVNRLCSEIKLFDLCDQDVCNDRSGTYCTNRDMLARFERIADDEARHPAVAGLEDQDEDEDDFDRAYGDGFGDEYGDDAEEFEQD